MQKWTSWLTIKIWSTIVILVELNKSTIIFNKNLRAFWSLQQELNEILKNQESCGIEELWRFRVKFGIIGTWYRGVWQLAPAAAVKHLARKMNKFWESSTFLYSSTILIIPSGKRPFVNFCTKLDTALIFAPCARIRFTSVNLTIFFFFAHTSCLWMKPCLKI